VGEVEGWGVDPQGPAQPTPRPVEALPEARNEVQSRLKLLTDVLDLDAVVGVEQPGAVEDGESPDAARPAEVVPGEYKEIGCGLAFQAACLAHNVTLLLVRRSRPSFRWETAVTRAEGPLQAGPHAPASLPYPRDRSNRRASIGCRITEFKDRAGMPDGRTSLASRTPPDPGSEPAAAIG